MNNFNIKVISQISKDIHNSKIGINEITINNYIETSYMSLSDWNLQDYEDQWNEGVKSLKNNDLSCIVIDVENLKNENAHVWLWTLYKVEQKVFFQKRCITQSILKKLNSKLKLSDFNKINCYQFLKERIANNSNHGINKKGEELFELCLDLQNAKPIFRFKDKIDISINASERLEEIEGSLYYSGNIKIGNYNENFIMNGEWWNFVEYKNQWHQGIERLNNHNTSCLVTTVQFEQNLCIMMWTLYKDTNLKKIFIQQQLLTYSILDNLIDDNKLLDYKENKKFNLTSCYDYIATKDNNKEISQWEINYE